MSGVRIGREGRAGRITLDRPAALNALTLDMVRAIDAALAAWAADPGLSVVLIEAAGGRAFCAGGDLAEMHAAGRAGDHARARAFWRAEYAMNARIAGYPKPVVAFLHGYVLGGGVGLGCHARLRIAGESAEIGLPECAIGLVPDTGGSALLARAPGRIGVWLGLTGARMGPADAIRAGFADAFLSEADWPAAKAAIVASGRAEVAGRSPPPGRLAACAPAIDRLFAADSVPAILAALGSEDSAVAREAREALARASPLSAACTLEMLRRLGPAPDIRDALALEYRVTTRALARGDFLEGIRAAVIDKDRRPRWRHAGPGDVTEAEVAAMLAPLGPGEGPELWEDVP